MAFNFRKFLKGIRLVPNAGTSVTAEGDIAYRDDTKKLEIHDGTTADNIVQEVKSATLTNKVLTGNTAVNLISGSGTLVLNTSGTATVPNATDTLVGKATTDTLTNKTLTGNTAVNLVSGSGTLVLNTSGTATVPNATDTLVGKATTDTLTNKTLTGNIAVNLVSGAATVTLPTTTSTLATLALSETLTNKTLTTPVIASISNGGTVTIPSGADTLVARTSTDTLTNKSISGSTNTITNVSLTTGVTGTLPIANGGTNATTANAGFNNLSPMITGGDIIYGGASGAATRLANGSSGQVLTSNGGTSAPSWQANGSPAANNQTSSYSILTSDQTINFTTGGSNVNATLPTAVGNSGKFFIINKVDSGAGSVNLVTTSSQTINGLASSVIFLGSQHDSITVISDGTNWQISDWNIQIAAKYQNTAATSVSNDNAFHTIPFATKIIDTYAQFVTDTFTTVIPGTYQIEVNALFASASWTATDQITGIFLVNGSTVISRFTWPLNVTASYVVPVFMSTIVKLAASDTVVFQLKQNDAGSRSLNANAGENTISIIRIGN